MVADRILEYAVAATPYLCAPLTVLVAAYFVFRGTSGRGGDT